MFLIQEKRKGDIHLCIVHSYRDPVTKKPKRRRVLNVGYLENLKSKYPDPIEHFTRVAEEMTAEYNNYNGCRDIGIRMSDVVPIDIENQKNLGYIAFSEIYHGLRLDDFFYNCQNVLKTSYSLNNIMKMLIFGQLLYPGSVSYIYRRRHRFFEKMDFTLEDVYDSFRHLSQYRAQMRQWIHARIRENYGRSRDPVYYYTTNHYFEVDYQKWHKAKNDASLSRPDPILQMGLFVDSHRIPITYELFQRNTYDIPLLSTALKRCQADFNISRVIVVADNSINGHNHLYRILSAGHGYIINQSIRSSEKKTQNYVLDPNDYVPISNGRKMKSREIARRLQITSSDGKKRTVTIRERQIVFYDPVFSRWASATRETILHWGKDLIACPSRNISSGGIGNSMFSSDTEYDSRSSIFRFTDHPFSIDPQQLIQEETFDGYYMLFTSELEQDPIEIIRAYDDFWEIEDTFRMKDKQFEARPVRLAWSHHLAAQFNSCFIALVIIRLLENHCRLPLNNNEIIRSLKKCTCVHLEENVYMQVYCDPILQKIGNAMNIDFNKRYRTLQEIRTALSRSAKPTRENEPEPVLEQTDSDSEDR